MSTPPHSSENLQPDQFSNPSTATATDKEDSPPTAVRAKLGKIPPIPVRQTPSKSEIAEGNDEGVDGGESEDEDESMILASSLGLNQIWTRSSSLLWPLLFPSSAGNPSNVGNDANRGNGRVSPRAKWSIPHHNPMFAEQGKKVQLGQSKSLKSPSPLSLGLEGPHALAKEVQSPRFHAILRVTSRSKNRAPDIKSFSHELNSKGVRPFPLWKSRALGHMEEIMVIIQAKFERLKEEVNTDLGIFAGYLVGILEKTSDSHPEWKEILEDLLVTARICVKMSPSEFWFKCEGIVQNLDDQRQELPMGTLKQAYTRLLFILTRCTRLVQFQKENGYEEDQILGLYQLSDFGVYPEKNFGTPHQGFTTSMETYQKKNSMEEKEVTERQTKKAHGQDQSELTIKQNHHVDNSFASGDDTVEITSAKSVASSTSSFRMSSWKKFPSAAEKNCKSPGSVDTPSKEKLDGLHVKDETAGVDDNTEILDIPFCTHENSDTSLKVQRVNWGLWGDQHNVACGNSFICRICEVEIPTVHVEEHSRICTIADRCDLKGLNVNERLERVAETLERILESWTPKSTDGSVGSPEVARVSASSMHGDLPELSPKRDSFSRQCYEEVLDRVPEDDNAFLMNDMNIFPDMPCEIRKKASSAGSLTPRSPLISPRTSQIELLLSGWRAISEHENYQQINKLVDISRSVSNANANDYSALEYLLDRLEDLKYTIQVKKGDALVVETFGRRIEKLLQEKYIHLCGHIEDEKAELSNAMVDEDSYGEDDMVHSLRTSPINPSKDRTSIEDFEIIKPISRGAFGRVFLARKRATGDLFAIKVLKKIDMIRKNAVENILAERNILISVQNPFVVRFFYSFTCRDNLYLVMEYLNGGDLYSLLRNLGCLDEDMARVYIAELVLALEYLHSLNVIHRDLKPDNLLIGPNGHIKLTDFGLSKVGLINSTDDLAGPLVSNSTLLGNNEPKTAAQSSMKREERQKHSVVGTPDYLAPEILLGTGHGATADWWSVGVILFELLVGIPPFNAEHPQQIFDNIMNRDIPWPRIPEEISYEAYDLIDRLLIENPVQRLGATGAREVKQHPFFKDINWDTLARQKAMFIPSAEAHDTSYFMSRYIWNPEDEDVGGSSDFDDLTETCSVSCSSCSCYTPDEDNLSQLASINYDLLKKSAKELPDSYKQSIP